MNRYEAGVGMWMSCGMLRVSGVVGAPFRWRAYGLRLLT